MRPKFKIDDLVTVIKGENVWYTYLDDLRQKLLGKTGRIIQVESQVFTVEDLEWYHRPKPWIPMVVHSYYVIFPAEPERKINMSEVHLKLFELER